MLFFGGRHVLRRGLPGIISSNILGMFLGPHVMGAMEMMGWIMQRKKATIAVMWRMGLVVAMGTMTMGTMTITLKGDPALILVPRGELVISASCWSEQGLRCILSSREIALASTDCHSSCDGLRVATTYSYLG